VDHTMLSNFVPSLYFQLLRFAAKSGAKPDRSIMAITNDGTSRTIGDKLQLHKGSDCGGSERLPVLPQTGTSPVVSP